MSVNLRILSKHEWDKLSAAQLQDPLFPTLHDLIQGTLSDVALAKLRAWMQEHNVSQDLLKPEGGAPQEETVTSIKTRDAPKKANKKTTAPATAKSAPAPAPKPETKPSAKPAEKPSAKPARTSEEAPPVAIDVDGEKESTHPEEDDVEHTPSEGDAGSVSTQSTWGNLRPKPAKTGKTLVPMSGEDQRTFVRTVRGVGAIIYLDLIVGNVQQPGISGRVLTISKGETNPVMDVLLARSTGEWTQARLTIPHLETEGSGGRILVMGLRNSRTTYDDVLTAFSAPARTFHPLEPQTWGEMLTGDETAIYTFYTRLGETLHLTFNREAEEMTYMDPDLDPSKHHKRSLVAGLTANIETLQRDLINDKVPDGSLYVSLDILLTRAYEMRLVAANHHLADRKKRINVDRLRILKNSHGYTLREAAVKLQEEFMKEGS